MQIKYIAGYKFTSINHLSHLRDTYLECCIRLGLKGTILLSQEGININLAGHAKAIDHFIMQLHSDPRFEDLTFKVSYSAHFPFKRMKVKIKKEIITMRTPEADPTVFRAPAVSPDTFKQWLDEKKDITVLDTRNEYEVRFGTFKNAQSLNINDFCEFPQQSSRIKKEKPIVMFCTGGIRCEKAALHLLNQGIKEVYQLEGGILNYFEKVGGAHYEGDCFVFDERVALDPNLNASGIQQCALCEGPSLSAKPCTCKQLPPPL